ncbi:MAG: adenosylcobinamide-GDP ribazoletransferase [Gemmatimonadota bacterium]
MEGVGTALRGARAAFVFLTRVPVGGFPYTKEEWRWSAGWFPFVGCVLGLCAAVVWWLATPLGGWPAAMTAIVFTMLVTGGFHEDGLADSADALGGAYDREKLFEILKDSRVGAFGALALVVSVVFRAGLLVELGGAAPAALVLSHTVARVGPIWLMVAMPYVTDAEAKSRLVTRAGPAQGVLAAMVGVGCMAALGAVGASPTGGVGSGPALVGALVAMVIATALCGWRFHARAGGVTGDFLGASEQVNEIVVLAALLMAGAGVPLLTAT